jgi:hypothetical protein
LMHAGEELEAAGSFPRRAMSSRTTAAS